MINPEDMYPEIAINKYKVGSREYDRCQELIERHGLDDGDGNNGGDNS